MDLANDLMDNCDGYKLVGLASSISIILAEKLNIDDQNVIGNLLLGIGQNLIIIATQNTKYQNCIQTCKDNNTSSS